MSGWRGDNLLIGLYGLEGLIFGAIASGPAGISLHQPRVVRIELVRMLEPLAGFLLVAGKFENQAGMHVLEQTVPIRPR